MKKLLFMLITMVFTTSLFGQNPVPKKYNRIISLSMASDEILYDLVSKDRILALSGNSDKNKMRSALWDKIDGFEEVHDNIEKVIALDPDIVIIPSWLKRNVVAQLEDAQLNIYTYPSPNTFEEEKEVVRKIAEVLDSKECGQEIIDDMDRRVKNLQNKIKAKGVKTLRVLEYSHYGSTNGEGSMFDDMLKHVYLQNVATEMGIERFSRISKEKVIEYNPEILIIPIWDSTNARECSKFFDIIKNDKSLADVDAVKNGQVYPIPGKYIYMYSHYIVEGMEYLGKTIHGIDISKEN